MGFVQMGFRQMGWRPLFSKVLLGSIGNYVTPGRKGVFELAAKELNNFADKTCQ
jgi:hypothetical protein